MKQVEHIDLSEQLHPIIRASNASRGGEAYRKYSKEANKIWQFPEDEQGIYIKNKGVEYGTHYSCKAAIKLAQGGNGLWQFAISYMLPNQGMATPLSVFKTLAFASRADALSAGQYGLYVCLDKVIKNEHRPNSDVKSAQKLLKEILDNPYEQGSLF